MAGSRLRGSWHARPTGRPSLTLPWMAARGSCRAAALRASCPRADANGMVFSVRGLSPFEDTAPAPPLMPTRWRQGPRCSHGAPSKPSGAAWTRSPCSRGRGSPWPRRRVETGLLVKPGLGVLNELEDVVFCEQKHTPKERVKSCGMRRLAPS